MLSMLSGLLKGGDAWAKDHDKILAHARGLHYDKVPGVTLPSADAPKDEWISAMDKFNAWKKIEVAKEADGKAWWQLYNSKSKPSGGHGGGGGSSGGGSSGDRTPSYGTTSPQAGNTGSQALDQSTEQMLGMMSSLTALISAMQNRTASPDEQEEVSKTPEPGSGLADTILTQTYLPSKEKKKKSYLTPISVG